MEEETYLFQSLGDLLALGHDMLPLLAQLNLLLLEILQLFGQWCKFLLDHVESLHALVVVPLESLNLRDVVGVLFFLFGQLFCKGFLLLDKRHVRRTLCRHTDESAVLLTLACCSSPSCRTWPCINHWYNLFWARMSSFWKGGGVSGQNTVRATAGLD